MPSEENQKRQRLKVRGALRLRQKIKKMMEAIGSLRLRQKINEMMKFGGALRLRQKIKKMMKVRGLRQNAKTITPFEERFTLVGRQKTLKDRVA